MARSRARYKVLVLACVLSVITFIDRVCISAAAPAIRQDLGLSAVEMGWVFSAFTFAYAAFEIPGGWLGDVLGPRQVLTRIVLWWSAFTMISGLAWSFVVARPGAFPLRRRRSGRLPEHLAQFREVVSHARTRHRRTAWCS